MRKKIAIGVVVVLALGAAVTLLRRHADAFDDRAHNRFQTALWQIKHLDTTFNQDLLKSRFALADNYDDFHALTEQLNQNVAELAKPPAFVTPAGHAKLAAAHAEILALTARRQELFERYKTRNAAVSNSRRYFPEAFEDLTASLSAAEPNEDTSQLHAATAAVGQLVLRRLSVRADVAALDSAVIDELKNWSVTHPDRAEARPAASLARHAQTIVNGKGEVDALTHQLTDLPTAAVIQKLFAAYQAELNVALARARQYRWFLYGLGALLVVAVGYSFVALRNINRSLDHRIRERTRTLFTKNAELEKEMSLNRQNTRALKESQALYNSLVEHLPAGVFRKDREGRFVFVNAWFCRLKQIKPEQILGLTPEELARKELATQPECPPESARETRMARQGVSDHETILRTSQPLERDEEYPVANGAALYLHVIKSPVFGADGTVVGSQGLMLDVTAARRAELALEFERHLLHSLLESSHDYIYFKDRDSRFLRCSRLLAERLSAADPGKVIGKTDFDFFMDEHARPAFEDERGIIRTGQPVIDKVEFERTKDGHTTWALTSKMPLRDVRGEIIGTFGISKDITAIKEAEAKLEQVHKQLLETSRQAGMAEVATTVLHNVGNVLNSVNVSATLVAEGLRKSKVLNLSKVVALLDDHAADLGTFLTQDDKGVQLPEYLRQLSKHLVQEQAGLRAELESLCKNVEHIKEIVTVQQDLANVSGVIETVSLAEVIEDALRLSGASLQRHGVTVRRELASLPPIAADRHKILQILVNLIRNAKHACEDANRDDKELVICTTCDEGLMKISVRDNGVGIPAENLDRIFNHGFTTKKHGHGFGLHSGANAAKEMGGALHVHSAGPGQGATFTLELPCELETVQV